MKNCVLTLLAAFLLFAAGCTVLPVIDPNTGMTHNTYALDPNNAVVQAAEAAAEVGSSVLPFLGATGALAGSALAGALAVWRKVKPGLATAKTLVTAIETFKTASPDAWETLKTKIKDQLTKQGVDAETITSVIEGIRESIRQIDAPRAETA